MTTVAPLGDGYRVSWADKPIWFSVQQLRESSDGLHSEVEVMADAGGQQGALHGPVRLNLTSTESQTRLANILAKRLNGYDWNSLVIGACRHVATAYRQGDAVADLSDGDEPGPVEYLLSPALPLEETTILYGDGEAAKSMLALYMGVCCRLGIKTAWSWTPSRQIEVLYLDYETTERVIKRRLWRIARGLGLAKIPTIRYLRPNRMLAEDIPNLKRHVQELNIGLVIVDSAGFATSGSLNEDQVARQFLNALRSLRCTRLVVHHLSKEASNQEKGAVKPFGSSYFFNGMRSGFECRRAESLQDGVIDVAMYQRKSNDGQRLREPVGARVTFDDPAGPIAFGAMQVASNPELAQRAPLMTRIRGLLSGEGRGLTATEIAESLDAKPATVLTTLKRMDSVERVGDAHRSTRDSKVCWNLVSRHV